MIGIFIFVGVLVVGIVVLAFYKVKWRTEEKDEERRHALALQEELAAEKVKKQR